MHRATLKPSTQFVPASNDQLDIDEDLEAIGFNEVSFDPKESKEHLTLQHDEKVESPFKQQEIFQKHDYDYAEQVTAHCTVSDTLNLISIALKSYVEKEVFIDFQGQVDSLAESMGTRDDINSVNAAVERVDAILMSILHRKALLLARIEGAILFILILALVVGGTIVFYHFFIEFSGDAVLPGLVIDAIFCVIGGRLTFGSVQNRKERILKKWTSAHD